MTESLLISLDFDNTFTADPDFWLTFISMCHLRGHTVVVITARRESFENRRELEEATGIPVYFAYDVPKKLFAEQNDLWVDIWIDDCPEAIVDLQPGGYDLV